MAAFLAASLAAQSLLPAVCVATQAAEVFRAGIAAGAAPAAATSSVIEATSPPAAGPFEIVPLEPPPNGTHRLAWASLAAGAGLIGLSFALTDRANDTYADYLVASDPAQVEHLYDRTRHYDRLSAASLLTGEALLATAVWLRFIHDRHASHVTLVAGPDRCALALRF